MAIPAMLKAALGLVAFSIILFLAGFVSNFWFSSSGGGFHFGLWLICSSRCRSYDQVLFTTPAHAYVGRFGTVYELIASITALVLMCLFVFKTPRERFAKSGYSLLLSGGIIGLLGAVVFIGREKSLDTRGTVNIGWSGICVILAAICQIVSAVIIILPIRRGEVEFEQV